MLKTRFGIFKYLFLRGDKVWSKLSPAEKQTILKVNKVFNVEREDYKNPEQYGKNRMVEGDNWDSNSLRLEFWRGKIINQIFDQIKPQNVLEIGPGPGFFSKMVCQKPFVNYYCGLDINQSFLNYLKPRLENLKTQKSSFNFQLLQGDLLETNLLEKFDFVLMVSTLHHIPNRLEFFNKLANCLESDKFVLVVEPSHYLPRKLTLSKNLWHYWKKSYYLNEENLSTHHMLCFGEFKALAKQAGFVVEKEWYVLPKKFFNQKIIAKHSWLRILSCEMAILLKKI